MKRFFLYFFGMFSMSGVAAQQLTVEKIMRDPKWIGTSPHHVHWAADSRAVYFLWNPEKADDDSLYSFALGKAAPVKVDKQERGDVPDNDVLFNKAHTKAVYEKYGDIFLRDLAARKTARITNTARLEYSPLFSSDEKKIFYTSDQNIYSWELATGSTVQLTDFRKGKKDAPPSLTPQEKWLREDQLKIFRVLKERDVKQKRGDQIRESENPARPKEIYTGDKNVEMLKISPDGKFIAYRLTKKAKRKNTIVPNYVTATGFTEDIDGRAKVGGSLNKQELYLYDLAEDSVYRISIADLPGIADAIPFTEIHGDSETKDNKDSEKKLRLVNFFQLSWSPDGSHAAVAIRAMDNKDRWIGLLDPVTKKLSPLNRLHDDAWVNYSMGWSFNKPHSGWLDNKKIWFLSEESGYNHLYTIDVTNGNKKALTGGHYEVQDVDVPDSKRYFYIITNEVHPGEKQLYRLPVAGGKTERLTTMTGAYQAWISPDEKNIALLYSYSNKPWELYIMENKHDIMENKHGNEARQVTYSLTSEFKSYPWRDPEIITFKARDSAIVYARLFRPRQPNGAAVIFVHGAGYLQNAHKWWSSYFREYMFHNLLADKGYTVLDMDYRASAGYGRDWRTAIYRFMGGKDLTDNVDGAKFLVDRYSIDKNRIGIYGGSYGGFITLMAMFTTPDVFAAGAALRPVTDWAHYNHGYTSNILNVPYTDSLAYARSSPIYYADGLKNPLLICHGMVDINVHFQDVVRLTQRLIELGKDNWELAVYPVESHGFVEPDSWTDEYKRILKLFETNLRKK